MWVYKKNTIAKGNVMIDINEVEKILDEIATELPERFYKELNGGILLLPQVKRNPIGKDNDLYVMGEYHHSGSMGRYIVIYYGSFEKLYGNLGRNALKKRLAHTLKHEFTHHLESLAGERNLEKEDEKFLEEYLKRNS
ncbi:MAG: metallopeptidase family protein [Eubacteriales bacterium]|nr:metallopeptidase family protein [Eubacteriales bacterium]